MVQIMVQIRIEPNGGWWKRLAEVVEQAGEETVIVLDTEAAVELAHQAKKRMAPGKTLHFAVAAADVADVMNWPVPGSPFRLLPKGNS